MQGNFYIVATPIGNLQDITLRAIQILSSVDVILAEDTRVTQKLLISLPTIHRPLLISYHQHSSEPRKLEILKMLMDGKNIALVTDAGTPGISDPGNELIDFILERSDKGILSLHDRISIVPIPGVSAITTALSVSGLNVNKFVFLGFLPKKKRTKLFSWLKAGNMPFSFYESPQRIIKTLGVIGEEFGTETPVFIARELTKMYETLYRGTVSEVTKMLQKEQVKGELVVIVSL